MSKSVHWRKDQTILARLVKVERGHLAHRTNTSIADELGVDEITIRRDLERIRELWRERASGKIEDMRASVVAELDDVRRLARESYEWDKSCERAVLFGGSLEDEDLDEQLRVYRDQKGSAQFRGGKSQALNVERQATMDKAKVLGIIVEKSSLTDNDGNSLAELILKARSDANSQ